MVKRPAHQEIISPVKSDSDEPTDYGVTSESSQVPQEGRDISYEVSEEALLKEFAELTEAEELSPYKEHEERIRPGFIERIPAIVDFLKKQRDAVETAQAALSKAQPPAPHRRAARCSQSWACRREYRARSVSVDR